MTIVRGRSDAGSTLIEVIIACGLMSVLMAGLMSLGAVAMSTTENQGHLAARTTEYAQDKLEQLVALAYTDVTTDTTTFPATACVSSCVGTGLAVGGSSSTSAPVAKYVDWLDQNGNLCGTTGAACAAPSGTTAPTSWFYERAWAVASPSTNLKQITVTVTIARAFGKANISSSTLTVLKTSPF